MELEGEEFDYPAPLRARDDAKEDFWPDGGARPEASRESLKEMSRLRPSKPGAIAVAVALALSVFLIDLSLPLGVAGGVPYVAVIVAGWWLERSYCVLGLAALSSALIVAGYYYSPEGGVPWVVLVNRFLAIFAVWATAIFLIRAKKAELSLRDAYEGLELRVEQRTTELARENAERRLAQGALRKSEERFAEILDIAADAIISTDGDGRIQLFNQGAEAVFGYTASELIGQPMEVLLPVRFREVHRRHIEDFGRSGDRSRLMGARAGIVGLRKDGTEFPARAAISKFAQGGESVFTVMLHDITDLMRAEDALHESRLALQERVAVLEDAQRRLEEQGADLVRLADDLHVARDEANTANRAKSEFLAAMSHELRTPLNAIMGFSEIIENEMLGPMGNAKYLDYVTDIHGSAQHLLELINDILDLSKIESGSDELLEAYVEVPEIVQSVLKLVKQRAHEHGVGLELDVPDALEMLCVDKRKLKQILVNLLANAVKFTDAGGKVALKVWCDTTSGFVFEIADTGIGMAPEDIPKALSKFGQIGSDTGRRQEGTGLGLPLSRALVEQHGGSLELVSAVGVGTTVTVRLPAGRVMRNVATGT